jgi:hypothetical protein
MKFEPLGKLAIDSFSMRIPVQDVTVISNKLQQELVHVWKGTGEIEKEIVVNDLTETRHGVKLTCKLTHLQSTGFGMPEAFFTLGVHSKLLGADYLSGMCADDMQRLYDAVMSFEIVDVPYDVFCAARVTDVDVKQDFTAPRDMVKERMYYMEESFKKSKAKKAGVTAHYDARSKVYTGHSFNDRKMTAYLKHPYMKVYDKTLDMLKNHNDFLKIHTGGHMPEKLWRQEFTLKGKKHMGMFEIDSTVHGILSADQLKLSNAGRHVMQALFEQLRVEKLKKDIAPRDMADMRFIWLLLNKTGMKLSDIVDVVTVDMDKSNKAKYKARFEALDHCDAATVEKDMWRQRIDDFLNFGGNGQNLPYEGREK